MNILYIITQGEHGGGQKHVLDLAANYRSAFLQDAASHTHVQQNIFVATGKRESEKDFWLQNELVKFGILPESIFEIKSLVREIDPISEIKACVEMWKLLSRVRPDIVHLHSVKAGILGSVVAKLWGAKVVYTVHGFTFLEPLSVFKKYFYIFCEFFASFFRDFTILISKKDLAAGRKYFILKDIHINDIAYKSRHELIYNGLDEDLKNSLLSKENARKYIFAKIGKSDEGQTILGNIANLYTTKGLQYAVMAMKKLVQEDGRKDILFVIFGEGEERRSLETMIKESGLENNFFLLGRTAAAYQYLKGLDLFVLTSVKEGLPYCILESLLAGVPVVATRVGGIPEVAEYAKITLAESADPDDIKNKIQQVLELQNGQKDVAHLPETFTLKKMLVRVAHIYETV